MVQRGRKFIQAGDTFSAWGNQAIDGEIQNARRLAQTVAPIRTSSNTSVLAAFYQAGGRKQNGASDMRKVAGGIGENIKTVEFGWPIGMPLCKPLGNGLFGVRTTLLVA